MSAQPLTEVTRRDLRDGHEVVESVHAGHLVVTGPHGEVVASVGDPHAVTYVRSAAKPVQATACLEVLDRCGVAPPDAHQLAVAWASHRAEPRHLDAVRALLARSNTAPDALTCPPAVGEADPGAPPRRLTHNCSGKHAMFALAGWALAAVGGDVEVDRDRLLAVDGPVQTVVLAALADVFGPLAAIGTDGCGAPAPAVPLVGLARGFARVASEPRFARVRAAGLAHPGLVGGEDRLESALLAAGVIAKVGAEGVYGVGWVDAGAGAWGMAVKAADGGVRGASEAVIRVLEGSGVVPPGTWASPPPLGGGRPAGTVRPAAAVAAIAAAPAVAAAPTRG